MAESAAASERHSDLAVSYDVSGDATQAHAAPGARRGGARARPLTRNRRAPLQSIAAATKLPNQIPICARCRLIVVRIFGYEVDPASFESEATVGNYLLLVVDTDSKALAKTLSKSYSTSENKGITNSTETLK